MLAINACRRRGLVELLDKKRGLIADAPVVKPLQVRILLVVSSHTPADGDEQDVESDNDRVQDAIDDTLQNGSAVSHGPINQEAQRQDGEIQGRVVVVHVGDTRHDDKRKIVQEPADDGVDTGIMDLFNLFVVQLSVSTLPSYNVPDHDEADEAERYRAAPVDEGVTKEEVLDNVVIPTAHTKSHVKDGPLPPLRGQIVLLVGIWHKGVIGCHHCYVEMNEVVNEGRLVNIGITLRN